MTGTTAKKSTQRGAIVPRIHNASYATMPSLADGENGPNEIYCRLNLNEAPFSPSRFALDAIEREASHLNRYPDASATPLVEELSRQTGLPQSAIFLGDGSTELLHQAALISIDPGDEAVMPQPSFPTCGKAVELAGGVIRYVPVLQDGSNDVTAMLAAIKPATRLFYLCTPNNPTGAVLSAQDLKRAISQVPDTCLLVVDEAYFEFARYEGSVDVLPLLAERIGPWLVTRTFSKAYCLAGLRVGYGLSTSPEVQHALSLVRPNFPVGRTGVSGALAALKDREHLNFVLKETILERNRLATELTDIGFGISPSFANFLTVQPTVPATHLVEKLKEHNVLVQALPWPGGNGSIRITVGKPDDSDKLISVLRTELM